MKFPAESLSQECARSLRGKGVVLAAYTALYARVANFCPTAVGILSAARLTGAFDARSRGAQLRWRCRGENTLREHDTCDSKVPIGVIILRVIFGLY